MGDWTFWQYAPKGEVFALDAFQSSIGQTVPLTYEGRHLGTVKLVRAVVVPPGRRASLTIESDDLDETARGITFGLEVGPA